MRHLHEIVVAMGREDVLVAATWRGRGGGGPHTECSIRGPGWWGGRGRGGGDGQDLGQLNVPCGTPGDGVGRGCQYQGRGIGSGGQDQG